MAFSPWLINGVILTTHESWDDPPRNNISPKKSTFESLIFPTSCLVGYGFVNSLEGNSCFGANIPMLKKHKTNKHLKMSLLFKMVIFLVFRGVHPYFKKKLHSPKNCQDSPAWTFRLQMTMAWRSSSRRRGPDNDEVYTSQWQLQKNGVLPHSELWPGPELIYPEINKIVLAKKSVFGRCYIQ